MDDALDRTLEEIEDVAEFKVVCAASWRPLVTLERQSTHVPKTSNSKARVCGGRGMLVRLKRFDGGECMLRMVSIIYS